MKKLLLTALLAIALLLPLGTTALAEEDTSAESEAVYLYVPGNAPAQTDVASMLPALHGVLLAMDNQGMTSSTADDDLSLDDAPKKKGKKVNIVKIVPWFICGFLALAIINSVGLIPTEVSALLKTISKFLMVSALAAIGLNTSLLDFKKAGLAPMFYGVTIDTLVTLTALAVVYFMGVMYV